MGTVGGLIFALGMCMGLVPEWNDTQQGTVVSLVTVLMVALLEKFIFSVWRENQEVDNHEKV
jgi:membrane protein implicated in regulation of membrane protease activity